MQHIMLDLETMDKTPTAAIAAIGAVAFDLTTGTLGKQFYQRVDIESSQQRGGTIGADTVKWWLRQPAEARSEVVADNAVSIEYALHEFACFITRNTPYQLLSPPTRNPQVRIWAQGTDFDLPIITSAMQRINMQVPWDYWSVSDARTITTAAKEHGIDLLAVPFVGEKHHALDDAIHQAKTVMYIWNLLFAPHRLGEQP
ncbi:3'-5' exoribonuclease [Serratia marcescens]|uniref:3'-5' exoribonuclease n=1 Tax=Serratia marcescens TaxID=615 RepID=A0A5C7CI82_SERMA|nr:3'-5' exonuclease [Serratia marcescens]TXE33228.1 3'-5' exoribonuclease [Serratia marcescens]TXE65248.1 3'-5' exoribonuclease [Serratia marcescens]